MDAKQGRPRKVGQRKTQPEEIPKHKGKMLVDATVCEQAIRYPTDMSLLNESREISESLIDDLYKLSDLHKKPRTYRQKARRDYLKIIKNKRSAIKLRRRCIREQLQYIRRNLGHISALLDYIGCLPFPLKHKKQRQYWIIQHLYDQQFGMIKISAKNVMIAL